jgi:ferritin-like metal-binding protein YciE
VKCFSENLGSLRNLYVNQLQMLLSTEQQITKVLPKMIEKATDPDLKQAFDSLLQETRNQSKGLQQIPQPTDETRAIKCKAVAGIITEAEDMIKRCLR